MKDRALACLGLALLMTANVVAWVVGVDLWEDQFDGRDDAWRES